MLSKPAPTHLHSSSHAALADLRQRQVGVEGRRLVRVLSVTQALGELHRHAHLRRGLPLPDLAPHPLRHLRVVGRRVLEGLPGHAPPHLLAPLPVLETLQQRCVVSRVHAHHHVRMVLRGGTAGTAESPSCSGRGRVGLKLGSSGALPLPASLARSLGRKGWRLTAPSCGRKQRERSRTSPDHRGASDVDVLDGDVVRGGRGGRDGLPEGVEVDHNHVDRLDALLLDRLRAP